MFAMLPDHNQKQNKTKNFNLILLTTFVHYFGFWPNICQK